MDGMAVFNFVISNVPNLINEIIEYAELKNEIDLALHQANLFMTNYLKKKIKIKQTPSVIDGFGNTGPTSIPILMTEFLNKNRINLSKLFYGLLVYPGERF